MPHLRRCCGRLSAISSSAGKETGAPFNTFRSSAPATLHRGVGWLQPLLWISRGEGGRGCGGGAPAVICSIYSLPPTHWCFRTYSDHIREVTERQDGQPEPAKLSVKSKHFEERGPWDCSPFLPHVVCFPPDLHLISGSLPVPGCVY